jgi:hypothetical protein
LRNSVIGLLFGFTLLNAPLRAEISIASLSPNEVNIALVAIEAAKKIAEAGRGALLMAGSVLSTDDVPSNNVLTILDYPNLEKMTPGSILLLAKKNCEPIENCLVARRVIGRDSSGSLQTERYGSAEPFLLDTIQATLLGSCTPWTCRPAAYVTCDRIAGGNICQSRKRLRRKRSAEFDSEPSDLVTSNFSWLPRRPPPFRPPVLGLNPQQIPQNYPKQSLF